jgi:hypothetical protein
MINSCRELCGKILEYLVEFHGAGPLFIMLRVPQLFKKFPAFMEPEFIIAFTRV